MTGDGTANASFVKARVSATASRLDRLAAVKQQYMFHLLTPPY